jgi:hypothetical protein
MILQVISLLGRALLVVLYFMLINISICRVSSFDGSHVLFHNRHIAGTTLRAARQGIVLGSPWGVSSSADDMPMIRMRCRQRRQDSFPKMTVSRRDEQARHEPNE